MVGKPELRHIFDKPLIGFERILETCLAYAPNVFNRIRQPCRFGSGTSYI